MMQLSVNTDFIKSIGNEKKPLQLIRDAGFKYIHWCHHWCTDYEYSQRRIRRIARLLEEYDLKVFDLHASMGIRKYWCSLNEKRRRAGEKLLENRIRMTHQLGGRAIVLHPNTKALSDESKRQTEQGIKTLRALEPVCADLGIRIGIENLFDHGGDAALYDLRAYFDEFSADFIGICWDTGHSNIITNGLERVAPFVAERLIILHLNGNYGKKDNHLPMGDGTNDWDRIIQMLADSTYDGVLTQEVVLEKSLSPAEFLTKVRNRGVEYAAKVEALRQERAVRESRALRDGQNVQV